MSFVTIKLLILAEWNYEGNYAILIRTGTVVAIDVNKGRLRILREAAKKHGVEDVVSTTPADIRSFVVSDFTSLNFR